MACGGGGDDDGTDLPQAGERVKLDPAEFTTRIDNPYWPMKPGSRWVYHEVHSEDLAQERVVVTVTNRTKSIANGIEARVVRDVVTEGGVPRPRSPMTGTRRTQMGTSGTWARRRPST